MSRVHERPDSASPNVSVQRRSKPEFHAVMARDKTQSLVEAKRIFAGLVGCQLNKAATAFLAFPDSPTEELFAYPLPAQS